MKKPTLIKTILALTILSFTTPVTLLQQAYPVHSQTVNQSINPQQSPAIVVGFPNTIEFKVEKNQSYPTTLLLTQPVLDNSGNVIAPASSPVQARLVPVKGGVQIIADALVAGGQVIPIQASSSTIPSQKIKSATTEERAAQNALLFSKLGGSVAGAVDKGSTDGRNMEVGSLAGNAAGILFGMVSSKKIEVVQIPQGSFYVLTLQAPLVPFTMAPPVGVSQQNQSNNAVLSTEVEKQSEAQQPASTATSSQFSFRNVAQYADTLEDLISAHTQGKISAAETRSSIEAANRFATTQLTQPLYPPAGLRKKIAKLFDFTYAIDQ